MKRVVLVAGLVVFVSACSSPTEPEEDVVTSPLPAAAGSPSESPDVEVDPNSAKFICEDLRLRDAYVQADDLAAHEEAQIYVKAVDAWTAALEDDAEPELREIAEASSDAEGAVEEMTRWCRENTDPMHEGDPW